MNRSLPRRRDERGASLIELAVGLLILAIVLTVVFGGFISFTRQTQSADIRLQNLDEARVLVNVTSKDLRTAARLTASSSPFLLADAREVTFYANLNTTTGPNLVHIFVDPSDSLIEEVTLPDAGSVAPDYTYTSTPQVRYVGRYVANTDLQPLFTYYDGDGVALATPLDDQGLLQVHSVGISFHIRKSTSLAVPATTVVNRVTLPNVYYNPIPSPNP